ncbi:tyrosine-type recombinase/integrase [Stieleria sp. ICT_E10.1]|uniref:tyrosine-type recombinase/integrase n=1 Tax=Stieleria sedimenti TaxID=2976331 RepID=UPI00217F4B95|nr:tyrosine-type recombinase/integrase [Stieleria sedimenti]MCS7467241.1 tyrosine-type recombinase/integrase [Stieleria sedimenti]
MPAITVDSWRRGRSPVHRGSVAWSSRTKHEGEHFVFHSLRHSCGAWLAIAGESIKVVQSVMRHSTPVLTLNNYGQLFPGQCEGAPVKLAAMMSDTKTAIRPQIGHIRQAGEG